MATLKEKIGYGFGDMSSSMFWKIFSITYRSSIRIFLA